MKELFGGVVYYSVVLGGVYLVVILVTKTGMQLRGCECFLHQWRRNREKRGGLMRTNEQRRCFDLQGVIEGKKIAARAYHLPKRVTILSEQAQSQRVVFVNAETDSFAMRWNRQLVFTAKKD